MNGLEIFLCIILAIILFPFMCIILTFILAQFDKYVSFIFEQFDKFR